ncbi:InlB B-repeat-containing protein [Intestinibacter sp.]|uniref:InlB B-repeat-containing protein n=1 Tax=Intestinibacter sp. TaxID=1965304 RepID=UPI003FA61078
MQQYTATFDTGSALISVIPTECTVNYGSLIEAPELQNIPENVTFLGWFKENGTSWDFAADKVYANLTLYAH